MIRLENVLKISLQDVLKMSSRRLQHILKRSWRCVEDVFQDVFAKRLENVIKTSWKRLEDVLKEYGQDEDEGLDQDVLKTSSENIRLRRKNLFWSRRLEDVFKKSSQDEDERRLQEIFRTSSSRRMFAGLLLLCSLEIQIRFILDLVLLIWHTCLREDLFMSLQETLHEKLHLRCKYCMTHNGKDAWVVILHSG